MIIANQFFSWFRINRNHRIILYCFASYTIISILLALIHQERFASIKFEIIPLLLLPAFLFFCYFLKNSRILYYIFPTATILIALVALYDKFYWGATRALEMQQPVIPAAGITITFSLFCLAIFFILYQEHFKFSLLILCISILGITASVLTGSRGAWLCFPIIFMFLLYHFRLHIPKIVKILFIPLLLILFLSALLFLNTGIVLRFEQIKTDLIWYFYDHNPNSSIGLRFEFWKSAIDGFLQKTFLGWGNEGYIPMKELQAKNGLIIPEAIPFVHAHNQFLDVLVKKGIFLLIPTLLIFVIPLYLFYKLRKKDENVAVFGYILVFNTFTFCLSDSFLRLPLGMIFYTMTIYTFLGFLLDYEKT